jgi:nucleotide-binding universal stress UspA family protein
LKPFTTEGILRILIAIDHSEASDEAVSAVIGQVKASGTEVKLLHVVDPFPERLAIRKGRQDAPDFAAARRELRTFAEKLLGRTAERLQAAGFSVNSSIQEGDVRVLILKEAKAWRADLIVLGAHPRRGIKRFFASSISEEVSREASCSVEIVRVPNYSECVPSVESSEGRRGQDAGRVDVSSSSDAAVSCFRCNRGGGLC